MLQGEIDARGGFEPLGSDHGPIASKKYEIFGMSVVETGFSGNAKDPQEGGEKQEQEGVPKEGLFSCGHRNGKSSLLMRRGRKLAKRGKAKRG